jgi:hypothetical protein
MDFLSSDISSDTSSSISSNISSSISSTPTKNEILVSEIQYEYINYLTKINLITIGKIYFSKQNKNKREKMIKQWEVALQCLSWIRLDDMDKHPEYKKTNLVDCYQPISIWEHTHLIEKNMASCYPAIFKDYQNNPDLSKLVDMYTDTINNKYIYSTQVHNTDKVQINEYDNKIYVDNKNNNIMYKHLIFPIDDRIKMLIRKTSVREVLRMLLRYSCIGIDGSHCSLPFEIYEYLYNNFNVKGEGFSSPLNSKLLEFDDTKMCTAFEDTDACFKSLGRFNKQVLVSNSNINWAINPPYLQTIIEFTFKEIIRALDEIERDDFLIILIIPQWNHVKIYNDIIYHKYTQRYIEPKLGKHYMNCNGKLVHMKNTINTMIFISKNQKYKDVDLTDLMNIWGSPNNDPKLGQSKFIGPIFNDNINASTSTSTSTGTGTGTGTGTNTIYEDEKKYISIKTDLPISIRKSINDKIEKYKKQNGGQIFYSNKYKKYIKKIKLFKQKYP